MRPIASRPMPMSRFAMSILAAAALCTRTLAAAEPASAPEEPSFFDTFRDSDDRDFDLSKFLLERKGGFLLVPIIITEPAVGTGGGAGALVFREPAQSEASKERGEKLPPNIYAVAAFKTSNGSRGGGLGGSLHFDDDRWRYLGGIVKTSMNLDFYTTGRSGETAKVGYNLDGIASLQEGALRIASSTYLSARWVYIDMESRFDHASDAAAFTSKERAERSSGLGLGIERDTRDNTLSPTDGTLVKANATLYAPPIGSDNRFQTYRAHAFGYFPFASRWTIAARADVRAARGDTPFYQLPSIDLRGIAYGRFQNENVGMLEGELRLKVASRWTLLGFTGVGRDWGRHASFSDATSEATRGVGFRYTLARALGLDVGIDWARGPDDNAYYLQVGTAWR
jgi:hypothetical protein